MDDDEHRKAWNRSDEITVTELPLPTCTAGGSEEERAFDADTGVTAGLLEAFRAKAYDAGYGQALQDVRVSLVAAAERFMFEYAVSLGMRPVVLDFGDFLQRYVQEMQKNQGFVEDGLGI
jgi:hypothetical protein